MNEPPRPSPLTLKLVQPLTDDLVRELAASLKGPVLRPNDPDYGERTRTFNGKLKSLSRLVVSPLDAHDVSVVVKFCVRHGFSPSVRAGGYGIAGWSVAGDVIIDMSKMTDIQIETPLPTSEAGEGGESVVDWTPIGALPLRTDDRQDVLAQPANEAVDEPGQQRSGKRRREDRSPSAGPEEDRPTIARGPYDNASYGLAAFLRGPPLPHEPGETAREPPTNRPRRHSPERESAPPPAGAGHASEARLEMLPLNESTRQLSGGSTSSEGSSIASALGFGSHHSQSSSSASAATTTAASPSDERGKSASAEGREPFSYVSGGPTQPPHLPMYGLPHSGYGGLSGMSANFSSLQWPIPPPPSAAGSSGEFAGVAAVNPPFGSRFGVAAISPFGIPPPGLGAGGAGLPPPLAFGLPPILGASAMPDPRADPLGPTQHFKPVHPHAYLTFGAGMRQKDIDLYSSEHPLEGTNAVTGNKQDSAVPYHIPMSAHPVGSSIMLLAGFGFVSRMYGLSIDNVVEVEMVLADGRIVVVNAAEDPDLWWAIRGAGPAFGIATRYKARAFPIPVVFAGNLVYRFHRATAPSLIKHFRDCIKGAPRELYANVLLTAGPADKDSLVVIQMCYNGPKEDGMPYLQAISSWDGERCLLNEVNEKSFLNQQDSVAQILRGRAGRQWFLRSSLITTLPDEVINRTVLEFADTPIGCTWIFELAGGAIGDFEDTCLPKEQREATWTVAALHQWDMGIDDPRCITTAEQWMNDTIKQVAVGGPYPTFLGRHEPPARTMACYGKNWDRLAALKRKYDPHGLFKNTFWPLDARGNPIESLANEPPSP
ncbi:hypothetical protein BC628DRAFT_1085902 [Trametes gibbosa]|nr:hypothetical protein BC628DRAFT_1085902 [Trametes gibbosa]